jgi:radical SAM protein with 4Fe4S-binding SPASM domain
MQFCGFAPDPCAKVQEPLDLKASWEKLREVSETVQTPEECKTCEHYAFCMRCPGLLASESGDPSKISETFCRRAIELHAIYDRLKAEEAEKNGETGLHTPE